MSPQRVEFAAAGTAAFAARLNLFLGATDEYTHLEPYYVREVLPRIRRTRRFFEVGPGTGASLTRKLGDFELGIGVEPTLALHEILTGNNPNMEVIGKKFQDVSDDEIAAAIRRRQEFDGKLKGAFDFAQLCHVVYYEAHPVCREWLERTATMLAPGASMFAALQAHESQYHEMYRHFVGQRYCLEDLALEFSREHSDWNIESVCLPGSVTLNNIHDAVEVAAFMLSYTPAEMPLEDDLCDWVETHFRQGNRYVTRNDQRVVIFTKPE